MLKYIPITIRPNKGKPRLLDTHTPLSGMRVNLDQPNQANHKPMTATTNY